MKIKIYYLIALLTILNSCKTTKNKFEWIPAVCAPQHYPVDIYQGYLILEDGRSYYLSCGAVEQSGWGRPHSIYLMGPDFKGVPFKLEVTWASYTEDKFYKGSWDLPKEKMLKLFREENRDDYTFDEIIVGLAPGGVVVVWMGSTHSKVEIARYQAQETTVSMKDMVPSNPNLSRESYMELDAETSAYIKKKGGIEFGLWDTYRKKHKWRAAMEVPNTEDYIIIFDLFNGEKERLIGETLLKNEFKERAIPKRIFYSFDTPEKLRYVIELVFDEEEIFDLFKKADATKPIEIIIKMDQDLKNKEFLFRQEDKEFAIKKVDLENMWHLRRKVE